MPVRPPFVGSARLSTAGAPAGLVHKRPAARSSYAGTGITVTRMSPLVPELESLARTQGGVFLARQAIAAGISHRELTRRCRHGELVHLRRGAYAMASATDGALTEPVRHKLLSRSALLVLLGEAWLSHQSAAVFHGLDQHRPDLSVVHVTRPGISSARVEAGVAHHDGGLPEHHRTIVDGVPVVSLGRTVIDVARSHSFDQAMVAADNALHAGLARADLEEALDFCRDWPGAAQAGSVVAFADGRTESAGESLTRCVLLRGGLAPDELQLVLPGGNGLRVDFAWTRWRVVLEFDGKVKYGRSLAPDGDASEVAWRERRRELAIERLGWVVVRVTWAEVVFHPQVVIERVREAIALAHARGLVGARGLARIR
ncbi:MAG TPA: type IV toxin-antitoxin system AbiEi family antitoxin domain-containing protein [Actinomycetes bacterium]|nr:type IV toxin-antitoxin system AbiEi family antitoxin domain-containing protein [Actinomycetes bacterium]